MDGDPVGEPSETEEHKSITDVLNDLCPGYMVMGMTYDQFWHSHTKVHKAYRSAFDIKKKNDEWARHRQGAYFMQALKVALQGFSKDKTNPEKYPSDPWPLSEKEAKEQQAARDRAGYEQALANRRAEIARRAELAKHKEASMDG